MSKDKHIRKAQRLVEAQMSQRAAIVAAGLTKAERLSAATDTALEVATEILALGVDPTDARILAIVKDTALSIIATQARLDAAQLAAASGGLGSLADDDLDSRIERKMRLVMAYEAEALAEAEAGEGREGDAVAGDAIDDVSDVGAEIGEEADGIAERPAEAAE